MTAADLAAGAPQIVIADAVPLVPRPSAAQDRVLPIFIIASLIVHATAILPSLLRHETDKAAAPKEIAVEVVQEAPKPAEKPKPPPKPQQQASKEPSKEPAKEPAKDAPKPEMSKKEPAKKEATKQEPPKKEAAKQEAAKKEPPKPQTARKEVAKREASRPPPKPVAKSEAKPQPKIESVADRFKQLIGPMPAVALPGASATGTEEVSYTQLVLSKLAKAKKEGRYQGTPGAAGVTFTVGDAGEVVKVEVVRPSGDKSLDDEAVAMVKRGAPYPLPTPGSQREYSITLRFQALI